MLLILEGRDSGLWSFGLNGQPGLSDEAVDEMGSVLVLDALSRFFTVAANWSTLLAARLPRGRLTCDQVPSAWLSSGAQVGQLDHGQPVVGVDELAHQRAGMGVQPVPDHDDRGLELVVREK